MKKTKSISAILCLNLVFQNGIGNMYTFLIVNLKNTPGNAFLASLIRQHVAPFGYILTAV